MGKKKAASKGNGESPVSKMGAIKAVLGKGLENPSEVAEQVKKEYGLDVPAAYVSNVKQLLKRSAGKKKTPRAPAKSPASPARKGGSSDRLDAAIEFCSEVGGVEAAKTLLAKIERIRNL